ncbi:MAG: DUF1552 domain-containing protein [Bdellovibrionota bacterium]
MIYNRKTRRQFLRGAGGTLLAIPFLPSLLPKALAAGSAPLRFICLGQDNGRYAPDWYPNATQMAKLVPVSGVQYMREMLMRNISGDISPIFGSAFNGAIRDKMMIISGLDGLWKNTQGHQMSTILAGNMGAGQKPEWEMKNGPSIDQVLGRNLKSNPRAADPKSVLNLRLRNGWDMSYRYNADTNVMSGTGGYISPSAAFSFVFGSGTTPALSDRKKKVVDLVLQNYKSVIGSSKLAKAEKDTLQEHIDSINQLETSINTDLTNLACVSPTGVGGEAGGGGIIAIDRVIQQHMDIMIAAVKCGIVNFGTIQTSDAVDDTVFSNLIAAGTPVDGSWHGTYSHSTMASPQIRAITQRFAGQFAYMINQLNVPEPGTSGTFLDNCLVYWGNAMGDGTAHSYGDMAVALAGGLGGRIRTGRFIDYNNTANGQGRNYNSFLVALLQAYGLSQTDYQQPNVAEGFGTDSLHRSDYQAWRLDRKNPAPGILV